MKFRLGTGAAVLVTLTASMLGTSAASAGETLVVDDDGIQCGADAHRTITAALDSAVAGDTIRICPGRYDGGIQVAKSVSLVGPLAPVTANYCLEDPAEPPDGDLTQVAVIEPPAPTSELDEPLVTLAADDIELSGLVLRGATDATAAVVDGYTVYTPALRTEDGFSGYRIHSNLIRANTLGIELGSSGSQPSRVHDNCLRENAWGLANQRETLTDALIDSNASYGTKQLAYEIGWGLAATTRVTLQGNTSRNDRSTVIVQNALSTLIADNTVTAPGVLGFAIQGGNTNVEIRDNVVTGTPEATGTTGISVFIPAGTRVPARSTGVVIDSNTISNIKTASGRGVGIALATGGSTGVKIVDNILTGNAQAGLSILNLNTDNLVQDNIARNNAGFGIRIQGTGSTNNRFQDNRMSGNGIDDARDDTDDPTIEGLQILSTWIDNTCQTDLPDGLCAAE